MVRLALWTTFVRHRRAKFMSEKIFNVRGAGRSARIKTTANHTFEAADGMEINTFTADYHAAPPARRVILTIVLVEMTINFA